MIPVRSIQLVNAVLGGALALVCYASFFAPAGPAARGEARRGKEEKQSAPEAKPEITLARYRVIEQANIFKNKDARPSKPQEPTPVPTPPPPPPPLDLELKGTMSSPRDGIAKAIIYNKKTRKTESYRKGDVLPDSGGAKILDITRSSVVIDRQGQSEAIELYPADLSKPALKPTISGMRPATSTRRLRR